MGNYERQKRECYTERTFELPQLWLSLLNTVVTWDLKPTYQYLCLWDYWYIIMYIQIFSFIRKKLTKDCEYKDDLHKNDCPFVRPFTEYNTTNPYHKNDHGQALLADCNNCMVRININVYLRHKAYDSKFFLCKTDAQ